MATSSITALGAGSGVDTVSLAKGLVDAERVPTKNLIDKKITSAEANISGYAAVKFVVDNLKTSLAELKNVSSFNNLNTINSQPAAFSADPTSTASQGYHSLEISSLASPQRNVSGGFFSGDTVLNNGEPFKLSLSLHGQYVQTISVTQVTPAGVVSAINGSFSGLSAELTNTGDVNAPYKITLKGTDGALNDFTLEPHNTTDAVTAVTTNGTDSTSESVELTFERDLAPNETITISGLTYTAPATGASAAQVASIFSNLTNGSFTSPNVDAVGGQLSGRLNGVSIGDVGDGNTLTAARVKTTPIELNQPVLAGATVSIGGLQYTPFEDASPQDIAEAYSNIPEGFPLQSDLPLNSEKGTYSGGPLTGFSTGDFFGSTILAFTQEEKLGDVKDIEIRGGPLVLVDDNDNALADLDFSTVLRTAGNANILVNGLAITSSTNIIEDAIKGVTLTLNSTTFGVANINFARDTTKIVGKMDAVVLAYNDANAMLGVVSDPKSTVDTYGGTLVGNSLVRQITNDLRKMITGSSSTPFDGIQALRDVGITVGSDGNLIVNATKRDSALRFHYAGVTTMFTGNQENLSTISETPAGVAGDSVKKLTQLLASTGALANQTNNAQKNITDYQDDLAKLELRMTALLTRYTKQFAIMDSMVGQSNRTREGLKSTFDGMMAAYTNN